MHTHPSCLDYFFFDGKFVFCFLNFSTCPRNFVILKLPRKVTRVWLLDMTTSDECFKHIARKRKERKKLLSCIEESLCPWFWLWWPGDNGSWKPYQPEYKTLSHTRSQNGSAVVYPIGKAAIQHKSEEYSQRIANQIGRHSPAWDAHTHNPLSVCHRRLLLTRAARAPKSKMMKGEKKERRRKNPSHHIRKHRAAAAAERATRSSLSYIDEKCVEL